MSTGKQKVGGDRKSGKLTPKQLHVARCVASGMSKAAAYREAYDVREGSKAASHQGSASQLMANPMIRGREEAIIKQKEAGIAASALSDRERVLTKLRHMIDHAEQNDGNKLRAAELLGKSVGLFKDVVETTDNKSSDDLLSDLELLLDSVSTDANTGSDTDCANIPEGDSTMH
jgi:hypothetical protein